MPNAQQQETLRLAEYMSQYRFCGDSQTYIKESLPFFDKLVDFSDELMSLPDGELAPIERYLRTFAENPDLLSEWLQDNQALILDFVSENYPDGFPRTADEWWDVADEEFKAEGASASAADWFKDLNRYDKETLLSLNGYCNGFDEYEYMDYYSDALDEFIRRMS
jgi:hypothetical protein